MKKLGRAAKRAYLNRYLVIELLIVFFSMAVSVFLVADFSHYYIGIMKLPIIGQPIAYGIYVMINSFVGQILGILAFFWVVIGSLMLPIGSQYWYWIHRDKRLDGVSYDTYMQWKLHKDIVRRQRERDMGCLGQLISLIWDIITTQFRVFTWLYWVRKTLSTFY